MSLPGTYSKKTLNGNWYEDRGAPDQLERDFAHLKSVRHFEPDIANLEKSFSVLERISRIPPHNSNGTICDYGYREVGSTNLEDFPHPDKQTAFVRKSASSPQFITSETIPEVVSDKRRPIGGPRTGYGATLQRHPKNIDQRFFATASRDGFGYPRPVPGVDRSKFRASGVGVLEVADRPEGMAVVGDGGLALSGERYRELGSCDISIATAVQRSWLYESDAALKNVERYGGKKPPPSIIDNHMSLPLGEGGHRKNHEKLVARGGRLPRIATSITTGKEKKYGINIFQDD